MLIHGQAGSGKTSAVCETWPKSSERKLHIAVAPGEQGAATIPQGHPAVAPYLLELDEGERLDSGLVVRLIEDTVFNILGGKFGPVGSFCFDGFHKYYGFILDNVSNGALFKGDLGKEADADPYASARMYNRARERARSFVGKVNASPVPNIVWTCWDGREADDPTKGFKSKTHIFPGLPGQAAKEFVGEFGLVVHSRIYWDQRDPAFIKTAPSRRIAKWQIKPEGDVWGAMTKAPIAVMDRLPDYCEQDYNVLKKILDDAWAAARPASP